MTTEYEQGRLIYVLSKSPVPYKGRYGPLTWQDWYSTCRLALKMLRPKDQLLIMSEFECPVDGRDDLPYVNAFRRLGLPDNRLTNIKYGLETIGQLQEVGRIAKESKKPLMVICTLTHFLRVKYLCWKDGIQAKVVCPILGLPRPREAITDLILTGLFPIVDLLHRRPEFLNRLTKRRESGTF